jgi:two-component system cell cycle sensor histidine kinase PleC
MSHELRTPLNAIIGFSDVIYHQRLGPDSKEKYLEYARDINASGSHLLSLVNDILDLSKIEANKEKLSISTVDIISLAGSAVNLLSEPMKVKNIRCIIEHSDNPLNIEGDERKLHQILINLLSNATKFNIEDGEIIIKLGAKDDLCHITVTDTGIGIPKDQINIALSRFGQIENSSRRQHDGTGIGLPLSKAMIELHGGLLEIESEEGKGTSITVTLPLAQPIQNTNAGASAVITAI